MIEEEPMSRLDLTSWQRQRLRRQLEETRDARLYRRTLAVLEYDRGRPVAEIARMLGVSRQSVYDWADLYTQEPDPTALEDQPGRGRPPLLDQDQEHLLEVLLYGSPQDFGLAPVNWNAPLLSEALELATEQAVSERTLRRVLHRLGYVWKRPRYDLEPDAELEKKTPHPPANPGSAAAQRRAGPGRNRPAAVPAAARRLGQTRRNHPGLAERAERPAGGLRGVEPADRQPAVRAAPHREEHRLPGVPRGGAAALQELKAYGALRETQLHPNEIEAQQVW
jgi:transposase